MSPRATVEMRRTAERASSWLSNARRLRGDTNRRPEQRRVQIALAITLLLTAKLIDHHNRWMPPEGDKLRTFSSRTVLPR